MDPKDYEIMGLNTDASIEDVKKRYDLLMRRSIHDESFDIDSITKAYDRIIEENTVDYFDPDADLLKKKGLNKKKLRNFIFQRKILIGIIIWAIIGIFLLIYLFFKPEAGGYMPDIAPII
jgi:hypothetical protein